MAAISTFDSVRTRRNRCVFKNKPVFLTLMDGGRVRFPCIVLYDRDSGVPLMYPGYERWYLNIGEAELLAGPTLARKANNVRSFLNFLLWETDCDTISDVTVKDLRAFYADFKETDDDEPRDPDGWNRGIQDVADFLRNYYLHNSGSFQFRYDPADLFVPDRNRKCGEKPARFGIKPPKKAGRKGRFILEGYRDMILSECRAYDPMIRLGVMLQSSAGLREGEIVNLTRGSIDLQDGGFGRISGIKIDLTDEAPFAKEYGGRSEFGKIKVRRTAEVYTDFVDEVYTMFQEHEKMLDSLGADRSPDAPLFINRWGKPMSVSTYKGRLQDIFQKRFVPDLERIAEMTGSWAEHAPYIEAWTDHIDPKTGKMVNAVYPGAHMFRHWFTMYLIDHTDMTTEEIAKWRGDSCSESMQDYIHVNSKMIRTFRDIVWKFQDKIMEDVINGEL